jgi:peroxiredoxin Q/BCP
MVKDPNNDYPGGQTMGTVMSGGMEWIVRFDCPAGGPDHGTVTSDDLAAEFDAVVVVLLRGHFCQLSRERAQAYSEAAGAFGDENVAVVAALPDTVDRAGYWRERYDLVFPVLADSTAHASSGDTGTAMTDGTTRFDDFADVEAGVDSLPAVGVLNAESSMPRLVHAEGGETIQECPEPEETLAVVRELV